MRDQNMTKVLMSNENFFWISRVSIYKSIEKAYQRKVMEDLYEIMNDKSEFPGYTETRDGVLKRCSKLLVKKQ